MEGLRAMERRDLKVSFAELKRLKRQAQERGVCFPKNQSEIEGQTPFALRSNQTSDALPPQPKHLKEVNDGRKLRQKQTARRRKQQQPWELSSATPQRPPTQGVCIAKRKAVPRDPRFSDLSGRLNTDMFAKSYGFLNSMRCEEKEELRRMVRQRRRRKKETISTDEEEEERERGIGHLNAIELAAAKKLFKRMESQDVQRKRLTELQTLKRSLRKADSDARERTEKKAFFFGKAKLKRLLKGSPNHQLDGQQADAEKHRAKKQKQS